MSEQNPADRALRLLARYGATIEYTEWYPDGLVNLDRSEITDDELGELVFSPGFAALILDRTQISDSGLASIGQMPGLEYLSLRKTSITDGGLSHLCDCSQLTSLDIGQPYQSLPSGLRPGPPDMINRNRISNEASRYLVEMPFLERLGLSATRIDDSGLGMIIPHLPQLCDVDVSYLNMTSDGLMECLSLRSLESINLKQTPVGGAAVVEVGCHFSHCLERLNLSNTTIDDDSLSRLPTDGALASLKLTDTGIGDRGVQSVSRLMKLRSLRLDSTDVTDDGIRFLDNTRSLRSLEVSNTRVSDTSLVWLTDNQLEYLGLGQTSITDVGMPDLAGMSTLRGADLSDNEITDRGVKFLLSSESLDTLYLEGTSITALGVITLSELRLRTLTLNRGLNKVSLQRLAGSQTLRSLAIWNEVETLEPLSRMSQLRVLLLDDSVTELTPVSHLRRLEYLFLCGREFCPVEVAKLRGKIPACRILQYPTVAHALCDFRRVARSH